MVAVAYIAAIVAVEKRNNDAILLSRREVVDGGNGRVERGHGGGWLAVVTRCYELSIRSTLPKSSGEVELRWKISKVVVFPCGRKTKLDAARKRCVEHDRK